MAYVAPGEQPQNPIVEPIEIPEVESVDTFQQYEPPAPPPLPIAEYVSLPNGVVVMGATGTEPLQTEDGGLSVGTFGHIRGGQQSFNVGAGFFIGFENGKYVQSIGDGDENFLTWDGTNLVFSGILTTLGLLGNGSDGDLEIGGTTTLSSDKYYKNLTINSGVILNTGGYKIYVLQTLTNNGTIRHIGSDGTAASGGTAGVGGAGAAAGSLAVGISGQTGDAGVVAAAGTNGNAPDNLTNGVGGGGSGGGNGGTSGVNAGGTGAGPSEDIETSVQVKSVLYSGTGNLTNNSTDTVRKNLLPAGTDSGVNFINGTAGGGGGGGSSGGSTSGTSGAGGGGGGGGGVVFIAAKTIINSSTGLISAAGGNGGNGGNGTTNSGGGGGGGSGGGGAIFLVYESLTNSGTILSPAGTPGSGGSGAGGSAAGTSGGTAGTGKVYRVQFN